TEINHRITIAIFISFVNRILLSTFYNDNRMSLWKDMFLSSTTSATRIDTSHADRFKTLPPSSTIPVLSTFYCRCHRDIQQLHFFTGVIRIPGPRDKVTLIDHM